MFPGRNTLTGTSTGARFCVLQVVKMLVAVVVLFAICWAPYLIDNVLTGFDVLPHARTGAKKHMRTAFHLLAYFNSCINPLVYGFMSRNFRRGFKSALRLSGQQNNFFCCSNKYLLFLFNLVCTSSIFYFKFFFFSSTEKSSVS